MKCKKQRKVKQVARYKVLYTDTGMGDVNLEREILASADIKLLTASGTDEETLISEGMHCDGIMVEYAEITSRILDAWGQGGKVKVVGRQGIGFNNIDVEAATRNNIMVTNVPDYCLDEVAEHTMALALNVLREIKSFDRRVVKGDLRSGPFARSIASKEAILRIWLWKYSKACGTQSTSVRI